MKAVECEEICWKLSDYTIKRHLLHYDLVVNLLNTKIWFIAESILLMKSIAIMINKYNFQLPKFFTSNLLPLLVIFTMNLFWSEQARAQVTCTGGVPTYNFDFTGNPSGVWNSPSLNRQGNCCGTTSPDRCLRFNFIADTGAAAISFEVTSGSLSPGALF